MASTSPTVASLKTREGGLQVWRVPRPRQQFTNLWQLSKHSNDWYDKHLYPAIIRWRNVSMLESDKSNFQKVQVVIFRNKSNSRGSLSVPGTVYTVPGQRKDPVCPWQWQLYLILDCALSTSRFIISRWNRNHHKSSTPPPPTPTPTPSPTLPPTSYSSSCYSCSLPLPSA